MMSSLPNSFEWQKNSKSAIYTAIICIIILLLFFYIRWEKQAELKPPTSLGIEVNLGNANDGFGTEQTISAMGGEQTATASSSPTVNQPESQDVTNSVGEEDVNLNKPTNNPVPIKNNFNPKQPNQPKSDKPILPKAVFAGVNKQAAAKNGNSKDGIDEFKPNGDGKGNFDKGKEDGTLNGKSFEGINGSGNSGIKISKGLKGRKITHYPTFEDDFNENAKVAVDVTVNKLGKVINATINPRGTNTTNQTIRKIAIKKAYELPFTGGTEEEELGTIQFNFKLKS